MLAEDGGATTIKFAELDVSQTKSIQRFRDFLKSEHPDGIDVVINNAGIAMDGFNAEVVKTTLQTNYYGTLEATQDLLPLVKNGGRMVNVCSMSGKLNKYSDETREAFVKASQTDVPAVTAVMERFEQAAAEGREKEAGFPSAAYATSKAGAIAMTKVVAAEEAKRGRGVLLNSCCPGYVNTVSLFMPFPRSGLPNGRLSGHDQGTWFKDYRPRCANTCHASFAGYRRQIWRFLAKRKGDRMVADVLSVMTLPMSPHKYETWKRFSLTPGLPFPPSTASATAADSWSI